MARPPTNAHITAQTGRPVSVHLCDRSDHPNPHRTIWSDSMGLADLGGRPARRLTPSHRPLAPELRDRGYWVSPGKLLAGKYIGHRDP